MSGFLHLPITALAAAALIVLYTVHSIRRRYTQHRISAANNCQQPPRQPTKDPFFGLDRIFETIRLSKAHILLQSSLDRFAKYGHTFRAKRLLTPIIVTREPLNIKTILSLKFKDYGLGTRIESFGPLLGYGIFTTDGGHWAQSRAMIRPNFVREQVADLDIFEEQMGDLFAMIPAGGGTVDLQELFFCYTIDSATEFLFGQSVQSLKKLREGLRDENDFATAFNYAQFAISTRARLGPLRVFFPDRRADECNRICHEFVEGFVDMALRYRAGAVDEEKVGGGGEKKRYVFLQGLAQQTGDRRRIRDELMNVLLAGRDTTASLLSNMFFMLARHPRVWKKLRDEVASLNGRPPTYEELRNLKYLKYCLNECTSPRTHAPIYRSKLTTLNPSPPHPPRRPLQRTLRQHRHRAPRRRRPNRRLARVRAQRRHRRLQRVVDAPARRHLRRRRPRVPPRALGRPAPELGIPPVQRRPAHLRRPAVRAH